MILLDDDEVRAESAARILRASGYEVQPVPGAALWRALKQLAESGTIEAHVADGHVHLTVDGQQFKIKR